jgi:hypothetical protein
MNRSCIELLESKVPFEELFYVVIPSISEAEV